MTARLPRTRTPNAALAVLWALSGCASANVSPRFAEPVAGPEANPPSAAAETRPGVLVMAHGAGEDWNGRVEAALEPLRDRIPVALALGMADPGTLQAALHVLEDEGVNTVAVVRLFVSGASFLHPTEFLLGLRPDAPRMAMVGHRMVDGSELDPLATSGRILLTREGLAGSDEVTGILLDRAGSAGPHPPETGLLLLAHGMGAEAENRQLLDAMQRSARALRSAGYGEVRLATLREDWAEARAEAERGIRAAVADMGERGRRVLVVPYRVSGFGPLRRGPRRSRIHPDRGLPSAPPDHKLDRSPGHFGPLFGRPVLAARAVRERGR